MDEKWVRMPTPFEAYEVSNLGKIRNRTGYNFRCGSSSCGYPRVGLSGSDGKSYQKLLHVLIAEIFVPKNNPEARFVHHKDRNKCNAKAINLEWVTHKENCRQRIQPKEGKRIRAVLRISTQGNIRRYKRLKDVPYNKSLVWKCCNRKIPLAYGYRWEYEDRRDLDGEKWISVPGGAFEVSTHGRVGTATGYRTFGYKTLNGYMIFKGKMVHRLVCLAFHGKPSDKKMVVNHKDSCKENNKPENLEWVTSSENRAKTRNWKAEVRKRKVAKISDNGNETVYQSIEAASIAENTSKGNICMVCKGMRNRCVGYKWEYRD